MARLIFIIGILFILWGYRLLAVPPTADHTEMLRRAKNGMLCVVVGGCCMMAWLAKR